METALYTAAVRDEIPVSFILVGPSGAAKSKLLKVYQSPCIHISDSITSAGLWDIVQKDEKNEKKFLLIPDINPTLSRRSSTTQATIGNLLSLTADGTVRIDDGRGEKVCKHNPMGLLTACTPEIYHKHARQWFALGLRRRIIPLFYTYSEITESALQKLVRDGRIHAAFLKPRTISFLTGQARPSIDQSLPLELEAKSEKLATNLGKLEFVEKKIRKWQIKDVVPISPHVTIRTLAMAHALRRKSAKVEKQELDFITQFIGFTDPEMPRQI
ncbi:MAG: hypothetical protein ACREBG_06000 [Pyrinomonadaceae bacterium]